MSQREITLFRRWLCRLNRSDDDDDDNVDDDDAVDDDDRDRLFALKRLSVERSFLRRSGYLDMKKNGL